MLFEVFFSFVILFWGLGICIFRSVRWLGSFVCRVRGFIMYLFVYFTIFLSVIWRKL